MALSADDRNALRKAAETFRKRAALNAAPYSHRIPVSLRVYSNGDHIGVVADGDIAPNAAPFEGAEFHPLFGDRSHWYQQQHRPFLSDAAKTEIGQAVEDYGDSVYNYARRKGFRDTVRHAA